MSLDFTHAVDVASAVGTLAAASLLILQIRSFEGWNRRQISHQMLNDVVSGTVEDILERLETRFGWDVLHDTRTYDDVVAGLRASGAPGDIDELDRLLRRLFRRFEVICISIDHRIVREETCKAYIFSLLTTLYLRSAGFIAQERRRRDEPRVFEYVERYAKRWQ